MGKGNMGRAFAASESMTLTESSAFTMQWRTCYDFNTKAGLPVFYDELKLLLQGLAPSRLHRRRDSPRSPQLRRLGKSRHHQLRLEEKGTVYNEMVSSMNNPDWALFRQFSLDLYGPNHPLGYNAGGDPAGIRELKPADIRDFHDRHYFLGNMGAIVSLPKGETVADELARIDQILSAVQILRHLAVKPKARTISHVPRPPPPAPSRSSISPSKTSSSPAMSGLAGPPFANSTLAIPCSFSSSSTASRATPAQTSTVSSSTAEPAAWISAHRESSAISARPGLSRHDRL